jgi:hypothetical protein
LEVRRGGFEELVFFRQAHDGTGFASLAHHGDAGDGVSGEESLIYRPIKKMPEHFDIAVEGGLREPFFAVAPGTIASHQALGNPADRVVREIRQEHFQPVEMVWERRAVREEPGRELTESHLWHGLDKLMPSSVQFLPKLAFDILRLAAA